MKFYRAMCLDEYNNTASTRLSFIRRYKWISPNKEFIINRVLDGEFGNSNFKPERYTHLIEIECEPNKLRKLNDNEYMMDRRYRKERVG